MPELEAMKEAVKLHTELAAKNEQENKLIRLCYESMAKGMTTVPIAYIDAIFGWSNDEGMDE